ncbi:MULTISPECIES: acyl carrier protein [Paludibacter]|uniref:Acyl carrier protein n=1 Tax=Paludibacter jiangxiensis TaxID=681398 RepID=A0A161LGG4_9BACT|nr:MULTISPECIES: acyl carrier protein [Paludibacter]MTK53257.1 acyl carrier protein [Paludibacter sp.]GAT63997.1 acyl carrier protein [Paludibacter jiangxiensis]
MELQDYISKFASRFDETPAEKFTADTEFKALDEWSSLSALTIIAMADEEYGVKIKGEDIRNSDTIKDLYAIVKSRA